MNRSARQVHKKAARTAFEKAAKEGASLNGAARKGATLVFFVLGPCAAEGGLFCRGGKLGTLSNIFTGGIAVF